jgi:glycosyltransferase involved in cell wall biosynthesis
MIAWITFTNIGRNEGYSDVAYNIVNNLKKYFEIDHINPIINDRPSSIVFSNSYKIYIHNNLPTYFDYLDGYNIGFTYWETNSLPNHWVEKMNQMDEIWTTSRWAKSVFEKSGVTAPVYSFDLGINPDLYYPSKRHRKPKFTFMSIGSPATRKNTQMAVSAFCNLFGKNELYNLVYKSNGIPDARFYYQDGTHSSLYNKPRINVIDSQLSDLDLSLLYNSVDCVLYPTSGEGWGLLPFQSIAAGIPTICTNATGCTEYAELSVPLDYKWSKINMSGIYENAGEWAEPSFDDLCDKMLYVTKNYDKVAEHTYKGSLEIAKKFTWQKVIEKYKRRLCRILN